VVPSGQRRDAAASLGAFWMALEPRWIDNRLHGQRLNVVHCGGTAVASQASRALMPDAPSAMDHETVTVQASNSFLARCLFKLGYDAVSAISRLSSKQ